MLSMGVRRARSIHSDEMPVIGPSPESLRSRPNSATQRVKFPTSLAKIFDVRWVSGVGLFREVGRRPIALNLIHVQGQPTRLNASARKHCEPVAIVAGHVQTIRIVIARVQDDRDQAVGEVQLKALSCLVLFALGIVAPAGEIRQAVFAADALNHAEESILLDPNLRPKSLTIPQVFAILLRYRLDNFSGSLQVDGRRTLGVRSSIASQSISPARRPFLTTMPRRL
jgi:hypothetical protein